MRSPIAIPMKIFIVMPADIPIEILVGISIGEGEAHAETLCPCCHPYRDPYCHPYRYPYKGVPTAIFAGGGEEADADTLRPL